MRTHLRLSRLTLSIVALLSLTACSSSATRSGEPTTVASNASRGLATVAIRAHLFKTGHNPFNGGNGEINADGYLAGGTPFFPSPFISRNITPDASGKPAGLTLEEFEHLIRSGIDPDHQTLLIQIMPWPYFRKMTDHGLHTIYEYLSAIPSNRRADGPPAGPCTGPINNRRSVDNLVLRYSVFWFC